MQYNSSRRKMFPQSLYWKWKMGITFSICFFINQLTTSNLHIYFISNFCFWIQRGGIIFRCQSSFAADDLLQWCIFLGPSTDPAICLLLLWEAAQGPEASMHPTTCLLPMERGSPASSDFNNTTTYLLLKEVAQYPAASKTPTHWPTQRHQNVLDI